MQLKEQMLSVGIDVGTSTTAVVFSQIVIENMSGSTKVPKYKIVDKKVIYRSLMYFTPLVSNTQLDVVALMAIVKAEYENAGANIADVSTGAVIITGDTARKQNAADVVAALSAYAGDFVVATAGPEMEGIIAGKGSGADRYSAEHICTIANLDIGGGTTNTSVFHDGHLMDVACFDLGGRLIRFGHNTQKIDYIYPKIEKIAKDLGIDAGEGRTLSEADARKICAKMADLTLESIGLLPRSPDFSAIVTNGKDFKTKTPLDRISFSGGVGELIYRPTQGNPFIFDDIGVLLAQAIRSRLEGTGATLVMPTETIGATVVGAGSHSMKISGSTIYQMKESLFPLKNIPILKVKEQDVGKEAFIAAIANRIDWMKDADGSLVNAALFLTGKPNMRFHEIQDLADWILLAMSPLINQFNLLTVVLENDFAKVLGQSMRLRLPPNIDLIVIDSIKVNDGDYIDIGKPLGGGSVVPVVVKTLVFNY